MTVDHRGFLKAKLKPKATHLKPFIHGGISSPSSNLHFRSPLSFLAKEKQQVKRIS